MLSFEPTANIENFNIITNVKDLPNIYDIKPGTIGRTQGDKKLKIPAKKAIVKGISWDMNFYTIIL